MNSFLFFKDDRERQVAKHPQVPTSKRPAGMPALDLQSSQDDEHAFRVRLNSVVSFIFNILQLCKY
jgi:hypothetical protein